MSIEELYQYIKLVWDYQHIPDQPTKVDLIFGLGSTDIRTAEHCAQLYLRGYAPKILFSGGIAHIDDPLVTDWGQPEAHEFRNKAMQLGVPEADILVEPNAQNTGENITLGYQTLEENKLEPKNMILVQKPYMLRRTYATFMKQWPGPEIDIKLSCIETTFDEYIWQESETERDRILNIMIGDLQRIKEYPKLGFQIEQEIPEEVWKAFEKLVEAGYDKHLIK